MFLTRTYTISIEGTGRWSAAGPEILEVALDHDDMGRLPQRSTFEVEIISLDAKPHRTVANIIAIDPTRGVLNLSVPDIPAWLHNQSRLDVRIILSERPFWRLLWGN